MTRWQKGEATIERLLAAGELQSVTGANADGQPWITKARRVLTSAAGLCETDPESAYLLAYDAARFACAALLTHQGLRATSAGGHYAIDVAVREQFGGPFEEFGGLRRQRNELAYQFVTDSVSSADASRAVSLSKKLVDTAEQMLPHLGLFSTGRGGG
jgi:hypothetical protein